MSDPLDALAVGLSADHQAEKTRRKRKPKDEATTTPPEGNAASTDPVATDATTPDAVTSDAPEASNDPAPVDPAPAADPAPSEPTATTSQPEPAPAAPGDDRETVMSRRLARLQTIVAETEFETGTALGDLVELIVDLFRHRPALWSAMSNDEQRTVVKHIESTAQTVLEKVVVAVAMEDSKAVHATLLSKFGINGDAIEAKIKVDHADDETILALHKLAGHAVVIVNADTKRFASRRREVETMPDQAAMQFADGPIQAPRTIKSEPPAPYTGDNADLADGADDETPTLTGNDDEPPAQDAAPAEDDKAPTDDGEHFGAFLSVNDEYFLPEGTKDRDGAEDWTKHKDDAGRWTRAEAERIVESFEASDGVTLIDLNAD